MLSPASCVPFLGLGLLVEGVGRTSVRPLPVLMPYDFRPVLGLGDRSEVVKRWEQGLVSGTRWSSKTVAGQSPLTRWVMWLCEHRLYRQLLSEERAWRDQLQSTTRRLQASNVSVALG